MESYLNVDGDRLYYQTTGSGPVLLIAQSGEGDADRSVDIVRQLASHFTVVTYDRRGLSRSVVADADRPISIGQHAEDAAAVVRAVADGPVAILGLSLGGVIGLHLLSAYPQMVLKLIAHEPIALRFLAEGDFEVACAKLRRVQKVYASDGWRAAAAEVAAVLGIDPLRQETEAEITQFPFTDQRAANFEFFLRNDLEAALTDTLTLARIPKDPRIIPAVGLTSPHDGFDYQAALALADHLGVAVEQFPGGHNGNLTHPRAFAEHVLRLIG